MKGHVRTPASAAAEISWLLMDYVEMCRILGPLPFRDFSAGYLYRPGTATVGHGVPIAPDDSERWDAGSPLFAADGCR
ncbi:MAG TPA: hypothetical protein VE974_06415 [Thermoanaerobaculia bacterium]|nr:hypothetical protein [Thermoanaerobaculia bacterium]